MEERLQSEQSSQTSLAPAKDTKWKNGAAKCRIESQTRNELPLYPIRTTCAAITPRDLI